MASSQSQSNPMPPPPPPSDAQHQPASQPTRTRLPIRTYHCSFCKQILLASTRDVVRLPTRQGGGLDGAGILPLPGKNMESGTGVEEEEEGEQGQEPRKTLDKSAGEGETAGGKKEKKEQPHYTILLSTTAPSTQPTIIRREDGFEKRFLIRCGRCRVVFGYALDRIHFPSKKDTEGDGEGEGGADVVYILPGAVVETGEMMKYTENKLDMAGWEKWEDLIPAS